MRDERDLALADYRPGALGRVCQLQAECYARAWGFGQAFEVKVAAEMVAFLKRFDATKDLFKIVLLDDEIVGSVTIDGHDRRTAHLRWFIVADGCRGQGIGRRLLTAALDFVRQKRFETVFLWTFDGLAAARRLYEQAGFELVQAQLGTSWGAPVVEQRFELSLHA